MWQMEKGRLFSTFVVHHSNAGLMGEAQKQYCRGSGHEDASVTAVCLNTGILPIFWSFCSNFYLDSARKCCHFKTFVIHNSNIPSVG